MEEKKKTKKNKTSQKKSKVNASNKEEKEITLKKNMNSEKVMLVVFCLLVIIVIILFTLVVLKHNELEKNPKANMVVPIYKESTSFHFSISAQALAEKKDYLFKITNFKDSEINPNDVNYKITINNDTDSVIKIVKNDEEKDLMKKKKNLTIEKETLKKGEERENSYYVKMISHGKLSNNDFIRVEIENLKQ